MASLPLDEAPVGRREDARVRVRLAARLVSLAGTQAVRLNNLSRGGASVTTELPMKRGADAILQWRNVEAFAQVTWVEGCRCGLRFEQPIPDEAVLLARSASDNRSSLLRAEQLAAARAFSKGTLRVGYGD